MAEFASKNVEKLPKKLNTGMQPPFDFTNISKEIYYLEDQDGEDVDIMARPCLRHIGK